jgi:hypothetical protein
MDIPRSRSDLEKLVADKVQESARLEYKASPALSFPKQTGEFAKDISAMANSDGGVIIYGITEKDHLPVGLDGGVSHASVTRERLEQLIISNIRPRPEFEIIQIDLTPDEAAFVVAIQRSDRPHQNTFDKRYYKRFNFSAHPMEDYEITDVRNRRMISEAELHIAFETRNHAVYFVVENVSRSSVFDVVFEFPVELGPWLQKRNAPALTQGFRTFPAGRRLRFFYGGYIGLVAPESPFPKQFDVSVSYRSQPDASAKRETLHVDLMDFFGSNVEKSDAEHIGEHITKGLEALAKQVERLAGLFDQHVGQMSTGTGVTLSVTALRNLRHVLAGSDQTEKVHPTEFTVVEEVLQVDRDLAIRIWEFLQFNPASDTLESLEGVTPDLADRIRQSFIIGRS